MIFIPSYKRADRLFEHNANHTLSYMDRLSLDDTFICVRNEEANSYLKVADKYGCRIIGLDIPPEAGIPETRDSIIEHAILMNCNKFIMIDDDLRLDVKPDARTYIRMNPEKDDFHKMVSDLNFHCTEEYPVIGITARQFSMEKIKPYDINNRIIQVYCIYIPVILKTRIRFSTAGFPFMTDYYFILSLLQAGYKNKCLNTYCRDDNAQTPGGCAETRTIENQSKSAVALYKKFPHLVSLYQKDTGTWKEPRVNARIAWRKAWKKA